ncbi:MAG: c-type cytochrome [Anaerolineae bacterium]|nr:c-type cytochrome [Anaerolineae bacterium]
MSKRIWIMLAVALVSVLALNACGSGDLAEDLTPIPTLPPGEVPTLVEPVESSAPVAAESDSLSEEELVALGEETFGTNCAFCHGTENGAGPAFPGMAARATEQVEGQSAADYIHESIVDPGAYVVEGFGAMPPVAGQLSDTEIAGLVAYILAQSGDGEMAAEIEEPEPAEEPTEEPTASPEPTAEPKPTEEPKPATEIEIDLELGATLFASNCAACHGATDGPGPALTGMATRAAEQVEGQSAEDYVYESIVDPSAHVVEGYSNIMPKAYGSQFSESELASIAGYILTETSDNMSAETAPAETESDTDTEADTEETAVEGNPEAGEQVFQANCAACHGAEDGPGPALTGMGERAAERVEDQSAEEYLHEAIVDPSAYVVKGFGDIMSQAYADQFSESDILNLIAYLLTQ